MKEELVGLSNYANKKEQWLDVEARALQQAATKYLASRKPGAKHGSKVALHAKHVGVKIGK